jgi:hypothetical protein
MVGPRISRRGLSGCGQRRSRGGAQEADEIDLVTVRFPALCSKWFTFMRIAKEETRGQRSNQLNYVPTLFSYLYRKPAYLVAFLRFNRVACVAHFDPIEPNSEVNGHRGHQAKPPSKTVVQANANPEQLSLPRD